MDSVLSKVEDKFGVDPLIREPSLEVISSDDFSAKVVISPLVGGRAVSCGNIIRRFLLSSLEGFAPTWVDSEKISHEFSVVEEIREDILDLILNLKKLVFASNLSEFTVNLSSSGGVVKARDLKIPSSVELVSDEDAYICFVNEGSELSIDIGFSSGVGYVERCLSSSSFTDRIELDANFSPVKKVSFSVAPINSTPGKIYEALTFNIETNGSVSPLDALNRVAGMIVDEFSSIFSFAKFSPSQPVEEEESDLPFPAVLLKKLDEIELSVRSANCLRSANVVYMGDLVEMTEGDILRTPNFGRKSLNEIRNVLIQHGLNFGMKLEGWPPENVSELIKKYDTPF